MTPYTESFEIFWKAYPWRWDRSMSTRIKRKKAPAFESWQKLDKEIQFECMAKRKMIRASEGSSCRDCVTWLNQKGWDDIELDKDKWKQSLPPEMADFFKDIPDPVNFHDKRNQQKDKLGIR